MLCKAVASGNIAYMTANISGDVTQLRMDVCCSPHSTAVILWLTAARLLLVCQFDKVGSAKEHSLSTPLAADWGSSRSSAANVVARPWQITI